MGNVCYTHYRVEGPTDGIRALAAKINADIAVGGENNLLSMMLYGQHMQSIVQGDIHPLNGEWSVLHFEAPSKWEPCWESWQNYAREIVPKAVLYYYGEEFGCNLCVTNDVWHKYFWFDYVTVLRSSHKTDKEILKTFADGGVFRQREDQWRQHFKYWDKRLLKGALLKFVPYPRRYTSELIEAMDRLMDREDWWSKKGTSLNIHKVKRLEVGREHPCNHCEAKYNLLCENVELYEKLNRLELLREEQKQIPCKTVVEQVD